MSDAVTDAIAEQQQQQQLQQAATATLGATTLTVEGNESARSYPLSPSAATTSCGRSVSAGADGATIEPTEEEISQALPPPPPPMPADASDAVVAAQILLAEEERMLATATARRDVMEAMREAELETSPETALPTPAPRNQQLAKKQYAGTRGSMYATGVVATGFLPIHGDDDSTGSDFDETDYVWDPVANEYVLSPEAAAAADARDASAAAAGGAAAKRS
jgi:hypothetical protein